MEITSAMTWISGVSPGSHFLEGFMPTDIMRLSWINGLQTTCCNHTGQQVVLASTRDLRQECVLIIMI